MRQIMRGVGRVVIDHPGVVAVLSLGMTLFLYAHIHDLRTQTDLTDMFGNHDPQWRAASQIGKELGYGNQLFVVIEAPGGTADASGATEAMADQLTAAMSGSGLFKEERSGLQEEELLRMVQYYSWNFPSLTAAGQADEIKKRLEPQEIRQNVRSAATEMVTPFSTMGADYFVADPLGLLQAAGKGQGASQFGNFDLSWGSGDRFFSKDHKALLVIAEPNEAAVDYKSAAKVVDWTREHLQSIEAEPEMRSAGVRGTQAGAYVFADEDHKFIEHNIRFVSMISIVGNVLLCLVVYPNIPMLLFSLLPASLGILCTTGIASYYPGEVNLISLAFIAILSGLGDDQIVHFFNRTPQEWAKGGTLRDAMLHTYETTGVSIVLCIVTAASATVALAASRFRALAEFGFILTVGMFLMMFHTLITVPALMQLWGRVVKTEKPKEITFRILPMVARKVVDFVGRRARLVVGVAAGLFLASMALLPTIKLGGHFEIAGGDNNPAAVAQSLLSQRFGIEGNPELLLIAGSEQEVLRRAEMITTGLETYEQRGVIKSVFSPTSLLPSEQTQRERAVMWSGFDMKASASALEASLKENGMQVGPHASYIERLRELANGEAPVTVESAAKYLPVGLIDSSLRRTKDGIYVAAVTYYATESASRGVPDAVLTSWREAYGPFVDFSFDKMSRDMQGLILQDSRRALVWTAGAILLIVLLTFRSLRVSVLVLMPIVFAIIVTFGVLRMVGHSFSFMSVTAIPLIIGIGIDNGIHLVRRYREGGGNSILVVARATGAALIQSNLTTIIGFGALMASTFTPLAELGLVTSIGVALALAGGLCVIPAVLLLEEQRRR